VFSYDGECRTVAAMPQSQCRSSQCHCNLETCLVRWMALARRSQVLDLADALLMPNPSLALGEASYLPDADETSDFDGRLLKYRQSGPMSPAIYHI